MPMDTFKNIHLASRMDQSVQAGRSGTTCVDTHSAKIAIIAIKRVCVDDSDAGADFGAGAGAGASVNEDSNKDGLDGNETTTESARIGKGEGKIDSGGNVWYGPVGIAKTRSLGDAVMLRARVLSTTYVTCF